MKIDDSIKKSTSLGVKSAQTRTEKSAEKASVGTGVDKAASDNVTLSPKAQALAEQSASTGVFNSDKVSQIKAAIASGTFKVNPEKVADGLIDTVKELISTRKG